MMHYRTISLPKDLVDRIEAIIHTLSYASISEYVKEKLRDPLRHDELTAESIKSNIRMIAAESDRVGFK